MIFRIIRSRLRGSVGFAPNFPFNIRHPLVIDRRYTDLSVRRIFVYQHIYAVNAL